MSGSIITIGNVGALTSAYIEAMQKNYPRADQIIERLPENIRIKIRQKTPSETDLSSIRYAIVELAVDGVNDLSPDSKTSLFTVFRAYCNKKGIGDVENTIDLDWVRDHTKDKNEGSYAKVFSLFKALEHISLQSKLKEWAGDNTNQLNAAQKIHDFIENPSSSRLDLSNLNLESLPDIFDHSVCRYRLRDFIVSQNNLVYLPESICNMEGLMVLYLSGNKLQAIPARIGNIRNLTNLSLEKNQLQDLPYSIAGLSKLTNLDLSYNRFSFVPEPILYLSSLKRLHLQNNQLQVIPDSVDNLKELNCLNVSENNLESIPRSIGKLNKLTNLSLSSNPILFVPDSIGLLDKLIVLSMANINTLQSLPSSLLHLKSNCQILLRNSNLTPQLADMLTEGIISLDGAAPKFHIPGIDVFSLDQARQINHILRRFHLECEKEGFVSFKTNYPALFSYMLKNNQLKITNEWIDRFLIIQKVMADNGDDLSNKILFYFELAEQNSSYRDVFFATIAEATITCGDRMVLSVLHLGIAYSHCVIDKTDLKGYANFLIHGSWMIEQLEEIARVKVIALESSNICGRRPDPIEVFLAYPVKLKERLSLQIDVGGMFHFGASDVNEQDLEDAASFIESQLSSSDSKASILVMRNDWLEALKVKCPIEFKQITDNRDKSIDALMSHANDCALQESLFIENEYKQRLKDLTKEALE
ncbi:MAG: hypothetical protein FJZ57_05005 [Chlamydiae bacterium]|nr:hypothetical protein [Chlamydiota bacterium]